MGARKLAEAVILQSLDDLSDARYRSESIDFFTGEGFSLCADIADLGVEDKLKIMGLVRRLTSQGQKRTRILESYSHRLVHSLVP